MNILDWIPAISTTSLLGCVLWLLRSVISTRLKSSVQHEFDEKLETLRTTLRNSEESFKADLRSKENEIAILRSGAISGLSSRLVVLDRRRIDAVEQLWAAVTALAPAKAVSATMAVIKFDAAVKVAADNPKAREMFAAIGGQLDKQKMYTSDADKARPFVSDIAWALFSAYRAIVAAAVIRLELLKTGLDMPEVLDTVATDKLITTALPHQAEYVKKFGADAYHHLLDEVESRLLDELRKMLQGVESDKATVEQAARILKESECVMASIDKSVQV